VRRGCGWGSAARPMRAKADAVLQSRPPMNGGQGTYMMPHVNPIPVPEPVPNHRRLRFLDDASGNNGACCCCPSCPLYLQSSRIMLCVCGWRREGGVSG